MQEYDAVPRIIWMLWFQGWDSAPQVCLDMLESWRLYNQGWEIRTISRSDFPRLLGKNIARYERIRQSMNLGDKFNLNEEQRLFFGENLIPPASESDLLRLYLLSKYGGVWVDSTNLCRRPLDEWLPAAAANGFFAFFGDRQSPEHNGVPHIISSFLVSSPRHPITVGWLKITIWHWEKPFNDRPDLGYLWVNKLFRKLVSADEGDAEAHWIWNKVPKISCEHGKTGPMWFYSSPEAIAQGARLFELMLAPPTQELQNAVETDHETPMWKLAFREELEANSAYWFICKRTKEQALEHQATLVGKKT